MSLRAQGTRNRRKRGKGYASLRSSNARERQLEKFNRSGLGGWGPRDTFDPSAGLKVIVLIALVFTGWVGLDYAIGGPLTHSYSPTAIDQATRQISALQDSCQRFQLPSTCKTASGNSLDPTYTITKYSAPSSDLSEFNLGGSSSNSFGQGPTFKSGCSFQTSTCMTFPGGGITGNVTTAASDQGIGSQGLASQHTTFYAQARWWMFYTGGSAFLNYTTATTPEGPWTEHGTGPNPFTIIESTSFACDFNNTEVVCAVGIHSGSSLFFEAGKLHNDGTVTWNGWVTVAEAGQVNTPEVVYEHTLQRFYISFNLANLACGPSNTAQSCSFYIYNSDSSLNFWTTRITIPGAYNQLPIGSASACAGDMVQTGVDAGNGSIYMTQYAFFIANSCNGNAALTISQPRGGFFGEYLTGSTVGPTEQIPTTPGFYSGTTIQSCGTQFSTGGNTGQPCNFGLQDFLFETGINQITGIFQYGIYCSPTSFACVGSTPSNTTLELTPLFATRSASGGWTIPARSTSDTGQFLAKAENSRLGGQMELASFGYDNATKEYIGEHICGAQMVNICDDTYVTIFNSGFGIVNPVISFNQFTGSYTYLGTGFNYFGMQPRYYPFSTNILFFVWDGTAPTAVIHAVSFSDTGNVNNPLFGIAESKAPIGDLSPVVSKELEGEFIANITAPSPFCGGYECSWGMFLTTNSSVWKTNTPLYSPYLDPSTALFLETDRSSSVAGGFAANLFVQTKAGEMLRTGDTGCHSGTGTNFLCATGTLGASAQAEFSYFDLNFTGAAAGNQIGGSVNCPVTSTSGGGNGCSYIVLNGCGSLSGGTCSAPNVYSAGSTTTFPAGFSLTGQTYYLGFYWGPGQINGKSIAFCFDNGNTCNVIQTLVANGCTSVSMEIDSCVPSPVTGNGANPTTDSGGFFGNVWRGLTTIGSGLISVTQPLWGPASSFLSSVGSSLLSDVLGGLETFVSFLETYFPAAIQIALNGVGNFFGWGNIGTEFVSFAQGVIQFFTIGLVTALTWLLALILRSLDLITVLNAWISIYLPGLLNVLANLLSTIVFVTTLVTKITVFLGQNYILLELLFFLWYTLDEGFTGWYNWFETSKWLAFISYDVLERMINFGISSVTWLIGRIPMFDGTTLPNLPTISISGGPSFPSARMNAVREGDFGAFIGTFLAAVGFIFCWSTGLFPGVTGNTGVVSMLPILYVFVSLAGVLLIVYVPAMIYTRGLGLTPDSLGPVLGKVSKFQLSVSRPQKGPSVHGAPRRREGRFGQKLQIRPLREERLERQAERQMGKQSAPEPMVREKPKIQSRLTAVKLKPPREKKEVEKSDT